MLLLSCNELDQQHIKHEMNVVPNNIGITHPSGTTIETRFTPPKGFTRPTASKNSYTSFLRNILLKPHGTEVLLYNGNEKRNKVADAVLSYDVGSKDLQQCADAVMRIRAEYLFSQKKYKEIHFNFTNGFTAHYSNWKNGERILIKSNKCSWVKKTSADSSHQTFRIYLEMVYNYAGSLSLSKELKSVSALKEIQAGDIFIIGGSPGHAVTVMDVAMNNAGEKVFMISQSFMPAQDIHILKNMNNTSISPWYSVQDIEDVIETPEYTFYQHHLMRFSEKE